MAEPQPQVDGRPSQLPKVVVFTTGGTISMLREPGGGGVVPRLSGRELVDMVPGLDRVAALEVREFGRYPGPHMTIDLMWRLRTAILETLESRPAGIVVTHGTDTIEETAYLLDRSLAAETPVVVTGAMRNASELSWDGPANVMAAVRVAASAAAHGRGTMVVMDERIVQGSEVVKTHADEAGTFQSPNWGPLGIVDQGSVLFYRKSRRKPPLTPIVPVQPVDLIKIVAGADSRNIEASLASGAEGVVLEALGRGNVPPMVLPGIRQWLDAGKPVVVTSRSLRGRVLDSYGYLGGGHALHEMGVIFADHMAGQQARVELMLALGASGSDDRAIRATFEAGHYDTHTSAPPVESREIGT